METATSPAIIALTLAALGAVLTAWWVSIQRERRRARLVEWIKANHAASWAALPWIFAPVLAGQRDRTPAFARGLATTWIS